MGSADVDLPTGHSWRGKWRQMGIDGTDLRIAAMMETEKNHPGYLQIHPDDNVLVALSDLPAGYEVSLGGKSWILPEAVKAKHKFAAVALATGQEVVMYGVLVGKTTDSLSLGQPQTVGNVEHAAGDFSLGERKLDWTPPDTAAFQGC